MTDKRIKELRQICGREFVQWDCIVLECLAEIEILHRRIEEMEDEENQKSIERDLAT